MAQSLGYKPKLATGAVVDLDLFQTVPAISSGTGDSYTTKPDLNYALRFRENMQLQSNTGVNFSSVDDVNFKFSSSNDPMEISIYESNNNIPVTYLLKKSVKLISGDVKTEYITIGSAEKYKRIALSEPDVTEIMQVTDSDGNVWHEVPFLAQDSVFVDQINDVNTDDQLY